MRQIDNLVDSHPKLPAKSGKSAHIPDYDVTVIGAGPYGLSAAAYLKAAGLGVRVFGEPMEFWSNKMPEGMLLRSPRDASNFVDPNSACTLAGYEAANGRKIAFPISLKHFVEYG